MSTEVISSDIATIQDEDLLRRMWQQTEDVARKKEIRSQMYNLRESRVQEFQSSSDVHEETHHGGSRKESLVEEGLQTREIRTPEYSGKGVYEPPVIREETYTLCKNAGRGTNGKMQSECMIAKESGKRNVDGRNEEYYVHSEDHTAVMADGDDYRNTRGVARTTKTVKGEKIVTGDESRIVEGSKISSTSKSSSRIVSEHAGGIVDDRRVDEYNIKGDIAHGDLISRQVEHPDANTIVIRETRKLPDGSTVTSTRKEMKNAKTSSTSATSMQSSVSTGKVEERHEVKHHEQGYKHDVSGTRTIRHDEHDAAIPRETQIVRTTAEPDYRNEKLTSSQTEVRDSKHSQSRVRNEYSATSEKAGEQLHHSQRNTHTNINEKQVCDDNDKLISRTVEYPDSKTKVVKEVRRLPDGSTFTKTFTEIQDTQSGSIKNKVDVRSEKLDSEIAHRHATSEQNIRSTRNEKLVQQGQEIHRSRQEEVINRTVEHPDEHTTVTTETRILPDGRKVTSTHTEITGKAKAIHTSDESNLRSTVKNEKHSTQVRQSDVAERSVKTQNIKEDRLRSTKDNAISKQDVHIRSGNEEIIQRNVEHPDEFTTITTETRILPDGRKVTSKYTEIKGKDNLRRDSDVSNASSTVINEKRQTAQTRKSNVSDHTIRKTTAEDRVLSRRDATIRDEKDIEVTHLSIRDTVKGDKRDTTQISKDVSDKRRPSSQREPLIDIGHDTRVNEMIVEKFPPTPYDDSFPRTPKVSTTVKKDLSTDVEFVHTERENINREHADKTGTVSMTEKIVTVPVERDTDKVKPNREVETYKLVPQEKKDQPERQVPKKTSAEPVVPQKTRISEDISPTHHAFASSLRADGVFVPGRRSPGSTKSLRSSTSTFTTRTESPNLKPKFSPQPTKEYKKPTASHKPDDAIGRNRQPVSNTISPTKTNYKTSKPTDNSKNQPTPMNRTEPKTNGIHKTPNAKAPTKSNVKNQPRYGQDGDSSPTTTASELEFIKPEFPSTKERPDAREKHQYERRETYDERCRKLLGMPDDTDTYKLRRRTTVEDDLIRKEKLAEETNRTVTNNKESETYLDYDKERKITDTDISHGYVDHKKLYGESAYDSLDYRTTDKETKTNLSSLFGKRDKPDDRTELMRDTKEYSDTHTYDGTKIDSNRTTINEKTVDTEYTNKILERSPEGYNPDTILGRTSTEYNRSVLKSTDSSQRKLDQYPYPSSSAPKSRDNSPIQPEHTYPELTAPSSRDSSPRRSEPTYPGSPAPKSRDTSPRKSEHTYPGSSAPESRDTSPRRTAPIYPRSPALKSRDTSPRKPEQSYPGSSVPKSRDPSPRKPEYTYPDSASPKSRDTSPRKPEYGRPKEPKSRDSCPPRKSEPVTRNFKDTISRKPEVSYYGSSPKSTDTSRGKPVSTHPGFTTPKARDTSPRKPDHIHHRPRDSSPKKLVNTYPTSTLPKSRDSSPKKPDYTYTRPTAPKSRDISPTKPEYTYPGSTTPKSRDTSPKKTDNLYPDSPVSKSRDSSPTKPDYSYPGAIVPTSRDSSPRKPEYTYNVRSTTTKTTTSTIKSRDTSPRKSGYIYDDSIPRARDISPRKPSYRDTSPTKPEYSYPGSKTPKSRDTSPRKDYSYPQSTKPKSRDTSPRKPEPSHYSSITPKSRDTSPKKIQPTYGRSKPDKTLPTSVSPKQRDEVTNSSHRLISNKKLTNKSVDEIVESTTKDISKHTTSDKTYTRYYSPHSKDSPQYKYTEFPPQRSSPDGSPEREFRDTYLRKDTIELSADHNISERKSIDKNTEFSSEIKYGEKISQFPSQRALDERPEMKTGNYPRSPEHRDRSPTSKLSEFPSQRSPHGSPDRQTQRFSPEYRNVSPKRSVCDSPSQRPEYDLFDKTSHPKSTSPDYKSPRDKIQEISQQFILQESIERTPDKTSTPYDIQTPRKRVPDIPVHRPSYSRNENTIEKVSSSKRAYSDELRNQETREVKHGNRSPYSIYEDRDVDTEYIVESTSPVKYDDETRKELSTSVKHKYYSDHTQEGFDTRTSSKRTDKVVSDTITKRNKTITSPRTTSVITKKSTVSKSTLPSRSTTTTVKINTHAREMPKHTIEKHDKYTKKTIQNRTNSAPVERDSVSNRKFTEKIVRTTSDNLLKTTQQKTHIKEDSKTNIKRKQDSSKYITNKTYDKPTRDTSPVGPYEGIGKQRIPDRSNQFEDGTKRDRPKIRKFPNLDDEISTTSRTVRDDVVRNQQHNLRSSVTKASKTDISTFKLTDKDVRNKFIEEVDEDKRKASLKKYKDRENSEDIYISEDHLVSSNDKVSKFLTTAEQITKPLESGVTSYKYDRETDEKSLNTDYRPYTVSKLVNRFSECTYGEQLEKETDEIETDHQYRSHLKDTTYSEGHPGTPRDPTSSAPRSTASPVPLRSTEAVKRAKELFENIIHQETSSTKRPSTPSTWEGKKSPEVKLTDIGVYDKKERYTPDSSRKQETDYNLSTSHKRVDTFTTSGRRSTSLKDIYDVDDEEYIDKTRTSRIDKTTIPETRSTSKQDYYNEKNTEVSHETTYDQYTSRSGSRGSEYSSVNISRTGSPRNAVKFGVTLRRTDSDKIEKRPTDNEPLIFPAIEDTYDIKVLEEMLETISSYDVRRKIRAQIRLLKQNEKRTETHSYNSPKPKSPSQGASSPTKGSPVRTHPSRPSTKKNETEYQHSYSKTSSEYNRRNPVYYEETTEYKKSSDNRTKKRDSTTIRNTRKDSPQHTCSRHHDSSSPRSLSPDGKTSRKSLSEHLFSAKTMSSSLKEKPQIRRSSQRSDEYDFRDSQEEDDTQVCRTTTMKEYYIRKDGKPEEQVRTRYTHVTRNGTSQSDIDKSKDKYTTRTNTERKTYLSTQKTSDKHAKNVRNVSTKGRVGSKSTATTMPRSILEPSTLTSTKIVQTGSAKKSSDKFSNRTDYAHDRYASSSPERETGTRVYRHEGIDDDGYLVTSYTIETTGTSSSPDLKNLSKVSGIISSEYLEDIWDEQTLNYLLEQCTSYDERRRIRSRLRQVMAERKAGADYVATASGACAAGEQIGAIPDDASSSVHGECLLLPLLQGLLDKKSSPRCYSSQSSEEGAPLAPIEDSGTESGEDLRFLAAGLSESIVMHRNDAPTTVQAEPLGEDLLQDVRSALTRLQTSLRSGGADCSVEPERRIALLQLVSRLQQGLTTPDSIPSTDAACEQAYDNTSKRSGNKRFPKRRNRQERHTVGVCGEDLAKARLLIGDIGYSNNTINYDSYDDVNANSPQYQYSLVKQISAGEVLHPPVRHPLFSRQTSSPVRNSTAKPFQPGNVTGNHVNDSLFEYLPSTINESGSIETSQLGVLPEIQQENNQNGYQLSRQKSGPSLNIGSDSFITSPLYDLHRNQVNSVTDYGNSMSENPLYGEEQWKYALDATENNSNLNNSNYGNMEMLQNNEGQAFDKNRNIYCPPSSHVQLDNGDNMTNETGRNILNTDISSAQKLLQMAANEQTNATKPTNKYASKKLKIKRTYTIDIPKSATSANLLQQNDSDPSDEDEPNQRNNNSKKNPSGLRGPMSVGQHKTAEDKAPVPAFKPKTENDHKFLAFLNRQNNETLNKPTWVAPKTMNSFQPRKQPNWNNCFGNIKHAFEKNSEKERSSSANSGNAYKFWQTVDDNTNQKIADVKSRKQGNAYMKNIFEKSEKISKLPWTGPKLESPKIVKGFLQVKTETKPTNTAKNAALSNYSSIISQPQPFVNKFSHAPMSAFKPPPKKLQLKGNEFSSGVQSGHIQPKLQKDTYHENQPIIEKHFNHGVKQLSKNTAPESIPQSSGNGLPWASNSNVNKKVLNLAATKFQQPQIQPQPTVPVHQRDRVQVPPILQQTFSQHTDKYPKVKPSHNILPEFKELSAPNLIQNIQSNNLQFNKPEVATPPVESKVHEEAFPAYTYTYTDYTQPSSVSTYVPILSDSENISQDEVLSMNQPIRSISDIDSSPVNHIRESKPQHSDQNVSVRSSKPLPIFHTIPATPEDDLSFKDIKEYIVASKVMTGPVMQQATTVSHKMSHVGQDDERNSEAALNLKSALKKFSSSLDDSPNKDAGLSNRMCRRFSNDDIDHKVLSGLSHQIPIPYAARQLPPAVQQEKFNPQKYNDELTSPSIRLNNYPISTHVYENNGESILSSKLQIPKQTYNSATPNGKNSSLDDLQRILLTPSPDSTNDAYTPRSSPINKSDSWLQKVQMNQHKPPSPRPSAGGRNLQKAKSSHTLAVPKQFEAGISRDEVDKKQKTVEAYFGNKSPQPVRKVTDTNSYQDSSNSYKHNTRHGSYQSRKSSINRTRTSEKSSIQNQNFGLSRSQTMPHIGANEIALLDESNVEDAFEDLFNSSVS